jgi:hypothetical protein
MLPLKYPTPMVTALAVLSLTLACSDAEHARSTLTLTSGGVSVVSCERSCATATDASHGSLTLDRYLEMIVPIIEPSGLVRTRAKWPQSHNLRAALDESVVAEISERLKYEDLLLEIISPGGQSLFSERLQTTSDVVFRFRDATFHIPSKCIVGSEAELGVRLVAAGGTARRSRSLVVRLPITWVESVEEVLTGVRSQELDARLAEQVIVMLGRAGPNRGELVGNIIIPGGVLPANLALGVDVLLFEGDVLRSKRTVWFSPPHRGIDHLKFGGLMLSFGPMWDDLDSTALRVVLVGNVDAALRDFDRSLYWDGGIIITPVVDMEE